MPVPKRIKNLQKKLTRKTLIDTTAKIFNQDEIQDYLIFNIQNRLETKGLDKFGNKLRTDRARQGKTTYGFYAILTEFLKSQGLTLDNNRKAVPSRQGKRPYKDRVTLNQEGDFYLSMNVIVSNTFYKLEADFDKKEGHIFENFKSSYSNETNFEDAILNLSDKEFDYFFKRIFLPEFLSNYKYELLK